MKFIMRWVECIQPLLLIPISLFGFDEAKLNTALTTWEKKNKNEAIVLITSPESGKIEFAYTEKNAFYKKLPPGSILKTLSSFVFLANQEKFHISSEQKYFCIGKFEEPTKDYFKAEDKIRFNLVEDSKTGKNYFRCSKEKGHGEITMRKALAESCNAYYLHFVSADSEFFYKTLIQDWRLDEGTGASFERTSTNAKILTHKIPTPFESSLTSIGDDGQIKLTALKLAQIYGAIFSDTPILMPILKGETPKQVSPFPYSDSIRRKIQQALRLTVKEGTLKNVHLQNTSIQILSGKTGTPTREGKKYTTHGWNIIYFKKGDNPYLLVVFVDKGSGKKEALELSTVILNIL
ncbi:MAG: hypothetical protein KBF99_02765 [Leptospiraceae bacterium]|nr:hypothetical protein [Leptospiraceae bacterium]